MTEGVHNSRREFLVAAAGASVALPRLSRRAGAATTPEQVRVGLIGVGIRGYELHRDILRSAHARVCGIVELSDHYIDRIRPELADPATPIHRDYRAVLDDKSIDAVVIATPDHWHAQMAMEALDAGKDVYVEKPLAYSFAEALMVRNKARSTGRVTQVGYQRRSMPHLRKVKELLQSGVLGEITHVQLWSSRNRATAPWRTYNDYNTGGLPSKSGLEHVDWDRFQANRPPRPYDPRRFFHWQCYEEYSTGIFGILMSHYLDAANLLLDLEIPATCAASGGIFKYDDDRTVPDTCSALFTYPARRISISFVGMSSNSFFDQEAEFRGAQGTLVLRTSGAQVYAEGTNALFEEFVPPDQAAEYRDLRARPVHEVRPLGGSSTLAHLEDFFINVKQRGRCHCPIEEAFKAMVGVAMAIESYKAQRTMHWDAEQSQIKG
jgi:predicted dehydrogenase